MNFYFDRVDLFFVLTSAHYVMRCLRKICIVTWKDKILNTEILRRCNITSVESIIRTSQLRWSGHVARMGDDRIAKALLFGLLEEGRQSQGGQRERYKDVLKTTLKACNIEPATWKTEAVNRSRWRRICHDGTATSRAARTAHLIARRKVRHAAVTNQAPTSSSSLTQIIMPFPTVPSFVRCT